MTETSNECLVCGKPCLNEWIEATVDDGKPPGTPHRWRKVGVVHEHCHTEFERNQNNDRNATSQTTTINSGISVHFNRKIKRTKQNKS